MIQTAQLLGWKVMRIRPIFDGKRKRWVTSIAADGRGWPDLTLVRERIVCAELKSGTGQPSPEQCAWLERLAAAGVECYVWRDTDYDAIVATLRRREVGGMWERRHECERPDTRPLGYNP